MPSRPAEAFLALAGDDRPDVRQAPERARETVRSQLESFHRIVLLTLVVELVSRRVLDRQPWKASSGPVDAFFPFAAAVCLALLYFPRSRRPAAVGAALVAAVSALWYLPASANHAFLMAICLFLLALTDPEVPEERLLALQGLRWCWVIVFFVSGVQKLVYGLYLEGEFLTYMIAHEETFGALFGLLLPASELERIHALTAAGGPFVSAWAPFAVVSNLVWLFEIAVPCFLLHRRSRPAAVALTLVFVVAIELGAREIFFGLMAVNLILLFTRRDWIRVLMPAYLVGFALMLLIEGGVLWPHLEFF